MKIIRFLNTKNLILAFILIIGLYLRLYNIDHGLPYIYNHDGQNLVEQALKYGRGTLRPFGFTHGALFSYILFAEYVAYFLVNMLLGKMSQPVDLLKQYILNPSLFFMLGRLTVVFFSMGILSLVYFTCRKFFDEKTGLIAALFTAVSFYMVYMSHLVKGDILVSFFIFCSFYFALKALKNKRNFKSLYICALLIGIAISIKYYGFIGISFIFLVLMLKMKYKEIAMPIFFKLSFICSVITAGTFLILNPYILIDFNKFIYDMSVLKGVYSVSYNLSNRLSWCWLFLLFLKEGVGTSIFYLYVLSLFVIFFNRNILLCNMYPVVLYIFLCCFKGAMPYFLVSVIPFVCISSAFLITRLASLLVKKKRFSNAIMFFIVIVFSIAPLTVSWKYCRLLEGKDTRTLAKRWIESNIKKDSSIIVEGAFTFNITGGGPPLRENINTLKRELKEINKTGGSGFLWRNKIKYISIQETPVYELYKTMGISPEDIKRYDPEYVILSNYYKPSGYSLSNLTRDYLKERYACIKKISPDVYINFFPSFEALYYFPLRTINKIKLLSFDNPYSYGPAIEIYKRAGWRSFE